MPGLNAAFINVGYERDAFLHYLDLGAQFRTQHKYYLTALQNKGKCHRYISSSWNLILTKMQNSRCSGHGQTVIVQITKEPISTKGHVWPPKFPLQEETLSDAIFR